MPLADELAALGERLRAALETAGNRSDLESVRLGFLGRSGELTALRRSIGTLLPTERPAAGKVINEAAAVYESWLQAAELRLQRGALEAELGHEIDVTFPSPKQLHGSLHPIRRTQEAAVGYFERRGFAVVLGPEIETEYYNFDALNIPPDHPAREGLDTFYVRPGMLLRAHTSPMQIRAMHVTPPPIALVVPGKVYRRDAVDARHSYMFHQIEGLQVAPGIHLGHLKGMLTGMCRELWGPQQAVRFRPSYFPFTEPSAEVDTTCPGCGGSGCQTCSGSGWVEIGGSGMVHPNVLREVGYDPDSVSGWAFGIGIERIAMVRHAIVDIRVFADNDPAFLEQLA